tara:strand:- start:422 stop:703 length:282 start_codon:yes stop_codon:yes gene_type:complete
MKILVSCFLLTSMFFAVTTNYSTTSVVTLVGAKIAASQKDVPVKKYKRKDCPVCKGKGWYISGDGIAKVSCGYCEPEDGKKPIDYSNPSIKIR